MNLNELVADIHAFRDYLKAERGLAENTLLAYTRDLERYAEWVGTVKLADASKPTLKDLARYIGFLHDCNLAAGTMARHIVSLRMFYRFLRLEERGDPTATDLLASPKLWERVPGVLSPANVIELLTNPKAGDRFYLRDRALLETLYATGCRASEVVGLRMHDLYLDSGFLKCTGKGSKQRVVPLGKPAVTALRDYLGEGRALVAKPSDTGACEYGSRNESRAPHSRRCSCSAQLGSSTPAVKSRHGCDLTKGMQVPRSVFSSRMLRTFLQSPFASRWTSRSCSVA